MKQQTRLVRRTAFTLIEIMIVIVIIGILASLAVPRVMDKLDQAKVETTKSNLRVLRGAVQSYKLDNGEYPQTLDELLAKNAQNGKGYLEDRALPKDGWGQDFVYLLPGNDTDFDIISYGADKAPGGTDVNEDLSCFGKEE